MTMLEKFVGGNSSTRRKLNALVDEVNRQGNMRGDGLINVNRVQGGVGLSLSLNQLLPRIPHGPRKFPAKLTDETTGSYSWVEVKLDLGSVSR